MGGLVVSFFAGTLSALSPCVLPLLPLTVASALQRHRNGPLALATGLVLSTSATGLFFASLGFTVGLDPDVGRRIAAGAMAVVGVVLLVPPLTEAFASVASPLASSAGALTTKIPSGLGGQFLLGLLLGIVWTPCTGPTLAAAITLAAQSETIARAVAVMLVFGVGAVVPVLALAYGSRRALGTQSATLARIGRIGKPAMGAALLLVGVLAFTRTDKSIEAWMVARMPDWLIDLTTRL
jgi:cytochrome c biogenesis protein CcdA